MKFMMFMLIQYSTVSQKGKADNSKFVAELFYGALARGLRGFNLTTDWRLKPRESSAKTG